MCSRVRKRSYPATRSTNCSMVSNSTFFVMKSRIALVPEPEGSGPISTITSARGRSGRLTVAAMAAMPPIECPQTMGRSSPSWAMNASASSASVRVL